MPADPRRGNGAEAYCPHCERSFAPGDEVCPDDGTELVQFSAEQEQLIGTVLAGRFEITARLGAGGMATVYRARQTSVGRDVAVKLIDPRLNRDRDTAKRFLREAKLASRLSQPNSVVVHDFGQHEDTLFIVMELLEGRTLQSLLAETGALPAARIRRIGAQLCDALEAAHSIGVIHRDLKPSNIMVLDKPVGRDVLKVLDFGLAKSLIGDTTATSITQSGAVMGTPLYMAPEMIQGQPVDERADIYSLGCILHEMAHGAPPFTAPTTSALFAMHLAEQPEPLQRPDLGATADVIARMLDKARELRPQTVAEVRDALLGGSSAHDATSPKLAGSVHGPMTVAPTLTAASSAEAAAEARAAVARRRKPRLAFAAALAAVVCGVLAWWMLSRDGAGESKQSPSTAATRVTDTAASAAQEPPAPGPVADTTAADSTDTDSAAADSAAADSAAADSAAADSAAPKRARVTMLIESEPPADLYVDGKKHSRTPVRLDGRAGDAVKLELRRNGYRTLRKTAVLSDRPLHLELQRRQRERATETPAEPHDAPPDVDFIPNR